MEPRCIAGQEGLVDGFLIVAIAAVSLCRMCCVGKCISMSFILCVLFAIITRGIIYMLCFIIIYILVRCQ